MVSKDLRRDTFKKETKLPKAIRTIGTDVMVLIGALTE